MLSLVFVEMNYLVYNDINTYFLVFLKKGVINEKNIISQATEKEKISMVLEKE